MEWITINSENVLLFKNNPIYLTYVKGHKKQINVHYSEMKTHIGNFQFQ